MSRRTAPFATATFMKGCALATTAATSMFTQTTRIPRSPLASSLTVVCHGCLALGVVFATALPSIPNAHKAETLTYIPAAALPDLTFEVPMAVTAPPVPLPLPLPEPSTRIEAPVIERPTPLLPSLAPALDEPVFEPPRATPAALTPGAPTPAGGAFAEASVAAPEPRRTAGIVAAGFETAASDTAGARRRLQASDGFESAATHRPAPSPPRTAGAPGFATDAPVRPAPAPPKAPVTTSAFGDVPAVPRPSPPQAPRPLRTDTPVELVYKPAPAYTDQARAQHIEGEVVLDVQFTADGRVHVLRVVRGLGHGLDEMAQRAAEQIRFKPATSGGSPVDVRTSLTILFRLT